MPANPEEKSQDESAAADPEAASADLPLMAAPAAAEADPDKPEEVDQD